MNKLSPVIDFKENLLDFFLPVYCVICKERIHLGQFSKFICKECYYNLPSAPTTEEIMDRLYELFSPDEICISEIYSLFSLKGNNFLDIIHSLKYEGYYNIGIEFGRMLGEKIQNSSGMKYDGLIPIPIHTAKQRERGYNQSKYIAEGISKTLDVAVNCSLAVRDKYTKSQTLLNAEQRKTNIRNVFKITTDSSFVTNKTFLLVDDVVTTGSTVNYLAMALLESGARKIDIATLGIA
jgi:ComF family protein